MRNFISLIALMLILSSSTPLRTNHSVCDPASGKTKFSNGPNVPASVVTSFNDLTTAVIRFRFNDLNATIDASTISWVHDGQGQWVASGRVYYVQGGGTGIDVSRAAFKHNGNAIDYVYTMF